MAIFKGVCIRLFIKVTLLRFIFEFDLLIGTYILDITILYEECKFQNAVEGNEATNLKDGKMQKK